MKKIKDLLKLEDISNFTLLRKINFRYIPFFLNFYKFLYTISKEKKKNVRLRKYLSEDVESYQFKKPVFIWGCPRTGTALMQHLLSLSPELITGTYQQKREHGYKIREGTKVWWDVFGNVKGEITEEIKPIHINLIKKRYIYDMNLKNEKRRLLDKSPFMILWVDKINEIFPDAYHIHMIRNSLAVANSIFYRYRYSTLKRDRDFREKKRPFGPYPKELEKYFKKDLAEFVARQLNYLISKGRSWKSLLNERYIEVLYGDLVKKPEELLHKICEKIEVDPKKIEIDIKIRDRNFKYRENKFEAKTYTKKKSILPSDIPKLRLMAKTMEELGFEFDI